MSAYRGNLNCFETIIVTPWKLNSLRNNEWPAFDTRICVIVIWHLSLWIVSTSSSSRSRSKYHPAAMKSSRSNQYSSYSLWFFESSFLTGSFICVIPKNPHSTNFPMLSSFLNLYAEWWIDRNNIESWNKSHRYISSMSILRTSLRHSFMCLRIFLIFGFPLLPRAWWMVVKIFSWI